MINLYWREMHRRNRVVPCKQPGFKVHGCCLWDKIVQRFSKYLLLMVKMTAMITSAWSLTLTLSISKLSLQSPAALPCSVVFSSRFYWGNKVISTALSAQSLHRVWLFVVPRTSPSVSLVHGISHARTLEWVAISYTRGFSPPRDRTHIACIGKRALYHWCHLGSLYGLRSSPNKSSQVLSFGATPNL